MSETLQTIDFTEADSKIQKGEGLKTQIFENADILLGHLRTLNSQFSTKQEGEKFEGISERLAVLKSVQDSLDGIKTTLKQIRENVDLEPKEQEEQWLEAIYSGMEAIQRQVETAKQGGNEAFFGELSDRMGDMMRAAKESHTLEDDLTLPFSFDYSILKKRVEATEAKLLREGFPPEEVRTDIRSAVEGILSTIPVEEEKEKEALAVGASLIDDYTKALEEQARLQQALDLHAQELGIDRDAIRKEKEAEFDLKNHAEHIALVDALGQTSRADSGAHTATNIAKKTCKDHKKVIKSAREEAIRKATDDALKTAIAAHPESTYMETIKASDTVNAKVDQLVQFMQSVVDVCAATRTAIGTIEEAQKSGSIAGSRDPNTVSLALLNSNVLVEAIDQVEAIRPAGNDAFALPAELIDITALLKALGYEGDFNKVLMQLLAKYPRKEVAKREPTVSTEGNEKGKGDEDATVAKAKQEKPAEAGAEKPAAAPAAPAAPASAAPGDAKKS